MSQYGTARVQPRPSRLQEDDAQRTMFLITAELAQRHVICEDQHQGLVELMWAHLQGCSAVYAVEAQSMSRAVVEETEAARRVLLAEEAHSTAADAVALAMTRISADAAAELRAIQTRCVCVCVCVCILLFRLPAEEDSNRGLQGGGQLRNRSTMLRKTRRKSGPPIPASFVPPPP